MQKASLPLSVTVRPTHPAPFQAGIPQRIEARHPRDAGYWFLIFFFFLHWKKGGFVNSSEAKVQQKASYLLSCTYNILKIVSKFPQRNTENELSQDKRVYFRIEGV